jgi:hypothetical protein
MELEWYAQIFLTDAPFVTPQGKFRQAAVAAYRTRASCFIHLIQAAYANTKRGFRDRAAFRIQIVRRYALLLPVVGKPAIDPHTPHPPLSSLGRTAREAAVSESPATFRPQE